jgi:N-acetylglutamate synthase-like GNAT family acetyltransferase
MRESMLVFQRARPEDAAALTELALRSKAHWGYDAEFIEDCRAALTIKPSEIERTPYYSLVEDGQTVGFYGLTILTTAIELSFLFIEPAAIGKGHGRRLFDHAVASARELGGSILLIESDPNAEGFYAAMGAERIGELPSPVRRERPLPLYRYYVRSAETTGSDLDRGR